MVFKNLSAVMNNVKSDVYYYDEVINVRRILRNNKNCMQPLYVVAMSSGHMFVVSEYMPAMTFEDMGANVFSVWRDANCEWHICKQ